MKRYMLKKPGEVFALFTQRGLIVEINDLREARMAQEEEAEDYGNPVEIVELTVASKTDRAGWFAVIDHAGRLMLDAADNLVVFDFYEEAARAAGKNRVGEFVRVEEE